MLQTSFTAAAAMTTNSRQWKCSNNC